VIDGTSIITASIPTIGIIVAAIINNRGQGQTHKKLDQGLVKLDDVATEVTTINGNTLANLADQREDRRLLGEDNDHT
jgi:hypothetical protein